MSISPPTPVIPPQASGNEDHWRSRLFQSRFPWKSRPLRPADVRSGLVAVMFDRQNILEDVDYRKIVPNRFVVELNQANYENNYQAIEPHILQQWRERMLVQLTLANSRLGRREFELRGRLQLEIRPAEDLQPHQARILCRVQSAGPETVTGETPAGGPCIELAPGRRRWYLQNTLVTLGRDRRCDIQLDMPDVLEKRLISSQHAYLRIEPRGVVLVDGSPAGKPSVNGTYVNYRRIDTNGQWLQDGDFIILAASDPGHPRPGVPGSVSFYFHQECSA